MIPQSVKNGRIKLNPSTIQNNVPLKLTILAPVSADRINSGPFPSTTIAITIAPITFDTRYSGVVENALLR